ncbi:MAG: hypothetical protein AAF304_09445 [Pseudomonadota bacterium]
MVRSSFFLLILIFIGGCESRKEIRVDVREIVLETPSGKYRFDAKDVGDSILISTPSLNIKVRTPKLSIHMILTSKPANFMVEPKDKEVSVQFESHGAFYQRDGKEKIPIKGTQNELHLQNGDWLASKWRIDLPPPISKVSHMSTPFLKASAIEAIKNIKGEAQRFLVPFRIDGERYSLDASIEYDIEHSWGLRSLSFGGLP